MKPHIKNNWGMKQFSLILGLGLVAAPLLSFGAANPAAEDKPAQAAPSLAANTGQADAKSDEQSFMELAHTIMANNKGVVIGDTPLSEEHRKWNEEVAQVSLNNAKLAGQFLTNFPASKHAADVAEAERQLLLKATYAGSSEARSRLEGLVAEKLKAPGLDEVDRFKLRAVQVQAAERVNGESTEENRAAYEHGVRQLVAEFPKRPEPYLMLLQATQGLDTAKRRAAIEELSSMPDVPEMVKQRVDGMLRQLKLAGHPLDIQFTAVDGREVDLAKYKGKVVLVDFWATWCGPCVAELPHVKEAYEKFHARGFEVVGISFDGEKSALEKFVAAKDMPWPQYFDGKKWENKFGQQYGIDSIPQMWLVDRDGNLVDTEARDGLAEKVERLLAGKQTPAAAK